MTATAAPGRLLLVDDDEEACRLLGEVLAREGYGVVRALSVEEALAALGGQGPFDAVLTDLRMPGSSGLDLLRAVRSRDPRALVFVLTAFGDATAAGEAIRAGAYDFISKPYDLPTLRRAIAQALERRHLAPPPAPPAATGPGAGAPVIVGHSPAIIEVMKTVARVAPSQATVLITGETGTGKELIARAIHGFSDRAPNHFVAVNCSALAEGVLESELFGHVKGAFTGAAGARPGLFREADRGTIFLDEVGDVSAALQARLLRVLQEREIQPVGSDLPVRVDVRVLAATHQDLEALVERGRFRGDLLYRLKVVTVELPPLRDRLQDLPLLVHHFLRQLAASHSREPVALDPEAEALLLGYSWPGNVRELQNVLERALVLAAQGVIGPEHLPEDLREGHAPASASPTATPAPATPHGQSPLRPLAEVEKAHVLWVLQAMNGNREKAARILGISRRTLVRMLQRWGEPPG
ncbi:MAG TPA: sigma-54 dependent transcriptional regulator [Gemmatimonadales bacterium]|jgi:DNA-binding NtrC family response regulator|nr:sigma-54 dependent transcriptional regulator [Gemmatimonadales bacterium]